MSEAEAIPTEIEGFGEIEDVEIEWKARPSMLPILGAAGGALVIGIGLGVGAALALGALGMGPNAPEEELPKVTIVEDLGTVNVNLRGEGGERVLAIRAQVEVETTDESRVSMLAPALRDGVLVLASDQTAEDLLVGQGRARFKGELRFRLDLLLGEDRVTDLYLTELVVK